MHPLPSDGNQAESDHVHDEGVDVIKGRACLVLTFKPNLLRQRDIPNIKVSPKSISAVYGDAVLSHTEPCIAGFRRASCSTIAYSLHCSSFLLVNQNLYYRILTIKLANQKKELQLRLQVGRR